MFSLIDKLEDSIKDTISKRFKDSVVNSMKFLNLITWSSAEHCKEFADKNVVSVIELFRPVLESADVNCDNSELEWFSLKWKCTKTSHFVAKSQTICQKSKH